jgi:hypothetical protein
MPLIRRPAAWCRQPSCRGGDPQAPVRCLVVPGRSYPRAEYEAPGCRSARDHGRPLGAGPARSRGGAGSTRCGSRTSDATSTTIMGSGTKRAVSSIAAAQVTTTSGMRHSSPSRLTAIPSPGVEHLARGARRGDRAPEGFARVALDPRMPQVVRRHKPNWQTADQLMPLLVRPVRAPGKELPDRHAGLDAHRGGGHTSILRPRG